MKLFMIAMNNIKKNKSMSIALVLLIISATILLYVGISVMLDINTFIDDKNKDLNGSDFSVLAPADYEQNLRATLKEMGGYDKYEEEALIIKGSADIRNVTQKGKSQSAGFVILNADKAGDISKLKVIDEADTKLENSIILPYFLKTSNGYNTGDEITITAGGTTNSFIVYGFAEDVMFATPSNVSFYKCYVFTDEFVKLYADENSQAILLKTKLKTGSDSEEYNADFVKTLNKKIKDISNTSMFLDYDTMKVGVSIFLVIMMAILIVFSLIIILIALTVMRFAIVTHIEGNIKNIGSMEALGYTGKQLIAATIMQFVIIAFLGTGLGFLVASSCAGVVAGIVSSTTGLGWIGKTNILAIIVSFLIVMISVVSIAYIAAAKIKKITPIMAMRNGIDTHNFKRNHFPLSQKSLNVNVAIGLKSLMQNTKQNITIMIIVILMSFVCVFSFTANYNFNVDNTAFIRLVGMEKSHLSFLYSGADSIKVFDEIGTMDHVVKTSRLMYKGMTISMGGKEITPDVYICDDFSKLEINTIIEGRYPIHDNEIVITGLIMKQLNAKLGDVVTVKETGKAQEFIIVGVKQQISQLGRSASITEEGMKRINPDFTPSQLGIYLDSSDNIPAVIKAIDDRYAGLQHQTINVEESFKTILATFNSGALLLCSVGIVFTIVIITLVLYLIINIRLLKERMRIGTAKAIGYTTRQLVIQIIVSFCPVCIIGSLIGTIAAMYLINPAFAAMLSSAGIVNSNLIIDPVVTVLTFFSISLFSIVITALVAMRIRKITPCELFI